jgi:hypothetical protein
MLRGGKRQTVGGETRGIDLFMAESHKFTGTSYYVTVSSVILKATTLCIFNKSELNVCKIVRMKLSKN